MQIIRTTRAQTVDTARGDTLPDATQEPVGTEVEGFFNDDFFGETAPESAPPSDPFDLLFTGAQAAPGTEGLNGEPSAAQFNPVNVVTLDEWLMSYPEGRYYIYKYRDRMQNILDIRFVRRLDNVNQSLQGQGLAPQEITALENLKTQLEAGIIKMQQEIDKADNKIAEVKDILGRERAAMRDLDGDGAIRDDDGKILYAIGKIDGQEVVLEKNGEGKWVPAANPYLDPDYQPALFSQDNLTLIDRGRHDAIQPGETEHDFDEAFELANVDRWLNGGFTDSTFGAQIDMSVPEGIWVEKGDDGKPVKENGRMKPKAFELVTRDDGKEMFGQTPPADDQRDKYIFVKVAGIDVTTPPVDQDNEVSGYVYFDLKDKDGQTVMKIRVQGVETRDRMSLNADGTHYIPANAVGVAFNAGLKEDGAATEHSSRPSPIEIDASRYVSTGRVLQANFLDSASVRDFYDELGIPSEEFATDYHTGLGNDEDYTGPERDDPDYDDYLRHAYAANDTLGGGFLDPIGRNAPPQLGFWELETVDPRPGEVANRFGMTWGAPDDGTARMTGTLTTMAAYLPKDRNGDNFYKPLKTGIFVKGLRGAFTGTQYNDIFDIPPPDDEAIKKLLPLGAQEIDSANPAYGTYVDAGGGKNIVVSKGGDLFAKGVTFLWREAADSSRSIKDQVYVAANDRLGSNTNLFMHVGDNNSEVYIDNGEDVNQNEVDRMSESDLEDDNTDPTDDEREVPSANDDWFETPNGTSFAHQHADTPGGLGADLPIADDGAIADTLEEKRGQIIDEAIKKDPLSDPSAYSGIDPELPPMVQREDKDWDAFFNEWEFFNDQETSDDLDPESL